MLMGSILSISHVNDLDSVSDHVSGVEIKVYHQFGKSSRFTLISILDFCTCHLPVISCQMLASNPTLS